MILLSINSREESLSLSAVTLHVWARNEIVSDNHQGNWRTHLSVESKQG